MGGVKILLPVITPHFYMTVLYKGLSYAKSYFILTINWSDRWCSHMPKMRKLRLSDLLKVT